ncbi:MAG: hypothetical protein LUC31_00205 [Coprobacillus sp.]|nr:hypothetical protein [Coprobacillus sp.]
MEDKTWIQNNWWTLVLIGFIILVLIIILIVGVYLLRRRKRVVPVQQNDFEKELVQAFGGDENIIAVTILGNKLQVEVNNFQIIDKTSLSRLGITHTVQKAHLLTISSSNSKKSVQEIESLLSNHIKGVKY